MFITHGGGLSIQEAVYHATPVIALPIFGDQDQNGEWIQDKGFGFNLVWEELTEEKLLHSINTILNDPT